MYLHYISCLRYTILVRNPRCVVQDQKGVSPLYIMLEIHHSGQEPSVCGSGPEGCISTVYHAWDTPFWSGTLGVWFITRRVYLHYISCLRYTILVRNPRCAVQDQKGVSPLYIMFEIHHSGQEPSVCGSGPEGCISTIYHV